MIKLVINKADGTHYWTEHFPTMEKATEWLDEEMTRQDWNKTYVHKFFDMTEERRKQDEESAAAVAAYKVKRQELIDKLLKTRGSKRTLNEANAAIDAIIDFLLPT